MEFNAGDRVRVVGYSDPEVPEANKAHILGRNGVVIGPDGEFIDVRLDEAVLNLQDWLLWPEDIEHV
jgi:hypothetical protein